MSTPSSQWKIGPDIIDCSVPVIVGIVNVTPDSFSDGGIFLDPSAACDQAFRLVSEGADIIDIGGESTRPGSDPVSPEEELNRIVPVLETLRKYNFDKPISIDTRRLTVAERAVELGATIVNDVTALRYDPDLAGFIAQNDLGVVLMHMQGSPKSMQAEPHYDDVIREIGEFFRERIDYATSEGISRERIALDPGIGFGKLLEHNLSILKSTHDWLDLGRPVLIGPSRKRFIGELLGVEPPERVYGTIGACVASLYAGARIFRVHDVRPVKQALDVAYRILSIDHD